MSYVYVTLLRGSLMLNKNYSISYFGIVLLCPVSNTWEARESDMLYEIADIRLLIRVFDL